MSDADSNKNVLIDQEDAVLVIIDMQDKLFRVMSKKEILIANTIKLAKFSRIMNLPVLSTEQENLGKTLYVIREDLPDICPISKLTFDCFEVDSFRESLKKLNRKTLIVTGIEAHICVTQTVLQALGEYKVHVVADAVSSRSAFNYEMALRRMAQGGATITTTEMVIFELLQKAGTDTFREALKLIK